MLSAVVWVDRYEDEYRVLHELDTMRGCLGQLEDYFDTTPWDPLLVFHVIDERVRYRGS